MALSRSFVLSTPSAIGSRAERGKNFMEPIINPRRIILWEMIIRRMRRRGCTYPITIMVSRKGA